MQIQTEANSNKCILKLGQIHFTIYTNTDWSKSWKLHQFHPDGDSWDIIGNILGHLLNLSATVSRYMIQGKTSRYTVFENIIQKMKIWRRRFFCIFVRVYASVIGRYTCHANYVIFAVYPALHISSAHREPTIVIFHHIHNILGVGP